MSINIGIIVCCILIYVTISMGTFSNISEDVRRSNNQFKYDIFLFSKTRISKNKIKLKDILFLIIIFGAEFIAALILIIPRLGDIIIINKGEDKK